MRYHIICCIAEKALCGGDPDRETDYPRICNRCLELEKKDNYCPLIPHDCKGQRNGEYA